MSLDLSHLNAKLVLPVDYKAVEFWLVGGGGTGNLAEAGGDIGLARMMFTRLPAFVPRAADLVEIDPGDGTAQARRFRLDPDA